MRALRRLSSADSLEGGTADLAPSIAGTPAARACGMGLLSVAAGWIGLWGVGFSEAAISSAGFLESEAAGALASATSVPGPSWSESALSAAGGVVCAASRGRATWSAIFRRPAFHSRAAALYRVEYRLLVRRVVRREAYRVVCVGAERAVRRETPEVAVPRCTPDR